MDATDWSNAELLMASVLGVVATMTFVSNRPAAAIASLFARLARWMRDRAT